MSKLLSLGFAFAQVRERMFEGPSATEDHRAQITRAGRATATITWQHLLRIPTCRVNRCRESWEVAHMLTASLQALMLRTSVKPKSAGSAPHELSRAVQELFRDLAKRVPFKGSGTHAISAGWPASHCGGKTTGGACLHPGTWRPYRCFAPAVPHAVPGEVPTQYFSIP